MPSRGALQQLLKVRTLEQEQADLALKTALTSLRGLEKQLALAQSRGQQGLRMAIKGACTGEIVERLGGLAEVRWALMQEARLKDWIAEAEERVADAQAACLVRRVERRQAETLVRAQEAEQAEIARRRSQQILDDWYLNRRHIRSGRPAALPKTSCSGELKKEHE